MFLVQQISPFHCFPACLASFFNDLNFSITQEEFVSRCPIPFRKGKDIEGAITINKESLKEVIDEFNIKIIIPTSQNIKIGPIDKLKHWIKTKLKKS